MNSHKHDAHTTTADLVKNDIFTVDVPLAFAAEQSLRLIASQQSRIDHELRQRRTAFLDSLLRSLGKKGVQFIFRKNSALAEGFEEVGWWHAGFFPYDR